jgi:hypothetical protein
MRWKLFNVGVKYIIVIESSAVLLKNRTLLVETNNFVLDFTVNNFKDFVDSKDNKDCI